MDGTCLAEGSVVGEGSFLGGGETMQRQVLVELDSGGRCVLRNLGEVGV